MEVFIEKGVIPDGYEVVRVGIPKRGEKWVGMHASVDEPTPVLIVKKIAPFRGTRSDTYYFVDSTLTVAEDIEVYSEADDKKYAAGNYFKTEKEARAAVTRIRSALKRSNK